MNNNANTVQVNENNNDSSRDDDSEKKPEDENKEILPGFTSFDDFVQAGFTVLKAGIKAANSLPAGENFNYYSCFPTFRNIRHEEIKKLLTSMQCVVECTGASGSMRRGDHEDKFELLTEANDILLDRATACMDKETGISNEASVQLITTQTKQTNFGSWNTSVIQSTSKTPDEGSSSAQGIRLLAAKNIQRPQLSFKDRIDNSSKPWQPRIKEKPNALKPLSVHLIDTEHGPAYSHPYEWELENLAYKDCQLTSRTPVKYKPLVDTPLIMVEKPHHLKTLLEDLRAYDEISVDLEHHSYRTFQGITCLMQISTKDTDYLIDTLSLRSDLHILNEIFTKPSVLKVFHGADSDIQWLQRDLSLYVVNMFDTHQAAKHLNLPYLSLAYLLKTHCSIDPNKHFQLADWRIRPLPEELMKYAREDTHYLLYIKDILTNALIEAAHGQTNILRAVYDRSTDICKRIYTKPVCLEDSHMTIYRKSQKMFNNRQLYALKELYSWRDETARQEDDSYGYVLPNHMLLNISETLPREMQGILACCNPIPPLVRQNLLKLHKLILRAREQPLIKPVLLEQDMRQRLAQRHQVETDAWSLLPHDMSNNEVQANLPCLLDAKGAERLQEIEIDVRPKVTIFQNEEGRGTVTEVEEKLRRVKTLFVSPFERYKRVLPMVAAQEARDVAKENKAASDKKAENEETQRSIASVRQHFLDMAKAVADDAEDRREQQPLCTMPGTKKRKREAETDDEVEVVYKKVDVSTPKPGRDSTFAGALNGRRIYKQDNQVASRRDDTRKPDERVFKGVRAFSGSADKTKVQKLKNRKELTQKGMLPNPNFDYKAVDFSSFQGGSRGDSAKTTVFQQKQFKDKSTKGKKKKKQKLGI
ncbi:exosome complex component 10 homolog [Diachasmimorpha longicaudata]|uniref:exosome complex component 10 homolog n=1 Tax=Diachasmimorpha longicaudata TaxID=58733 RepID=UPI0030B8F8F4